MLSHVVVMCLTWSETSGPRLVMAHDFHPSARWGKAEIGMTVSSLGLRTEFLASQRYITRPCPIDK